MSVCLNQNQKAFDYVNRDCLWYTMILKGIRGKMFNIIHSMYQNVKWQVRVNGVLSEQLDCHLGVRQGESLSPFLFSLFVNDMEQELKDKGVNGISIDDLKLYLLLYVVRAWREQHGSTSEIDSIAKAVVFYAGDECRLRPKISWIMWR